MSFVDKLLYIIVFYDSVHGAILVLYFLYAQHVTSALETAFYVCSLPRLTMRREEKYIFAMSPSSFWAARTMDQESNI